MCVPCVAHEGLIYKDPHPHTATGPSLATPKQPKDNKQPSGTAETEPLSLQTMCEPLKSPSKKKKKHLNRSAHSRKRTPGNMKRTSPTFQLREQCSADNSPEFAAHFRGVRPLRSRATGFPPFSKQKRTVGRWECHAAQCSTVYLHNKHNKGKQGQGQHDRWGTMPSPSP